MSVIIVVAYDESRVIGKDGKIPWHIPQDLKYFKSLTAGETVVMGRKTWDSLPNKFKPLPNRTNIVLTRQSLKDNHCIFCKDLETAVGFVPFGNVFIIGGAEVYKQALEKDLVSKVIASEVKGRHEGDVFFPQLSGWRSKVLKEYDDFNVVSYCRPESQ